MDNRDLEQLGDRIAELSAHLDAATARLLDLIREFDAHEGWSNGFRSCAHWLSWCVGLDLGPLRSYAPPVTVSVWPETKSLSGLQKR